MLALVIGGSLGRYRARDDREVAMRRPCGIRCRLLSVLGRAVARVEVHGPSMLPELVPGDRLLVRRTRRVGPGDLVVFMHPLEPHRPLVKRVVEVIEGGVVVAGDNAQVSIDSRHFGPVQASAVIGRPWYRYFPASARGRLQRRRV